MVAVLRRFSHSLDRHLHAQRLELAYQSGTLLLCVLAVEVVAAQILIARSLLEHVIDDHENAVTDRDQGALLTFDSNQALELCGEIGLRRS